MDLENGSWEAEEGVPRSQDPFIQRFLDGRDSLIQKEVSQRHDFNLHNSLPPVAHKACQIVSQVCAQGQAQIQKDESQLDGILHPSLMSDQARKRLEKSDLWRIIRRLPKGSLLHSHLPAMVDPEFLIDQAFTTPGIHMSSPTPLTTRADYQEAPLRFQYYSSLSAEVLKDKPTPWSHDYCAPTPIGLQTAAASFPDGGEAGFRRWLKSRCTLSPYHAGDGSRAVSDLFSRYLPIIGSLFHYEPIFRSCLRRIFSQLATDRIRYVELRVAFTFQYTLEGRDCAETHYDGWLQIFQEEVERFRSTEEGRKFYGARIIWATMRELSNKDIGLSMKQCLSAKHKFPDLICGFDLVGSEGRGRPLNDLLPILFWFRGRCADEGMDIPFIFHTGQCLGDGDEADDNLFDAVLLGSRRICQALSLYKHPLLIDIVKSKSILLEYSLTSSACFGLTTSFQSHPLAALLSRGVSVALSNDCPGIFDLGENGLSLEFGLALLASHNMGLTGLTMMVENSIRWSCYEDQSQKEWISDIEEGIVGESLKATRLQEFYTDFENFCKWVVQEFAEKYHVA
ncbi:putative CECR1 family adenosine deaminase [Aspergillus lucknowensis]|uniref:Adenosine deaminase domain-containing protein n=1 Tax=Aspergillus lucknowensis TaxID=176173 RepID=A0ABR4LZ88_9EURO